MVCLSARGPNTELTGTPDRITFTDAARVVKLVYTADLKSAAFLHKGRTGSTPVPGTNRANRRGCATLPLERRLQLPEDTTGLNITPADAHEMICSATNISRISFLA